MRSMGFRTVSPVGKGQVPVSWSRLQCVEWVCASLNGCGCGSNSAEINVGLVQSQAGAHQDPLWFFLPGRRSQVQSVVTEGVYFGCWLGAGTVTQHGACEWKCWCWCLQHPSWLNHLPHLRGQGQLVKCHFQNALLLFRG